MANFLLLTDGTSNLLLTDGSSKLLLADPTQLHTFTAGIRVFRRSVVPSFLKMTTGDYVLKTDGDKILLASTGSPPFSKLLTCGITVYYQIEKTFTAGIRVFKQTLKTFTAGLRVYKTFSKTLTAGIRVYKVQAKTLTAGIRVYKETDKTFTAGIRVFRPKTAIAFYFASKEQLNFTFTR